MVRWGQGAEQQQCGSDECGSEPQLRLRAAQPHSTAPFLANSSRSWVLGIERGGLHSSSTALLGAGQSPSLARGRMQSSGGRSASPGLAGQSPDPGLGPRERVGMRRAAAARPHGRQSSVASRQRAQQHLRPRGRGSPQRHSSPGAETCALGAALSAEFSVCGDRGPCGSQGCRQTWRWWGSLGFSCSHFPHAAKPCRADPSRFLASLDSGVGGGRRLPALSHRLSVSVCL